MRATPRELISKGFIAYIEGTAKSGYQCKTSAFFRIQVINYVLYNVFDISDLKLDATKDPKLDKPVASTNEIDELNYVLQGITKAIVCINMKCKPEKYEWSCDLKHGSLLKAPQFAKYSIMHHHVILRPEISSLVSTSKKYVTGDWILYKINEATKEIYIIGLFIHPDNIIRYKILHEAWLNKTGDIKSVIAELDNKFNTQDPEKIKSITQFSTQWLDKINSNVVDEIMQAENWV
jgi:hypothetical protein